MAVTELTTDLDIIAALDDEPNDVSGLTPALAKAKFDEGPNAIKDYINDTLIPELDAAHLPYQYGSSDTIKQTMENLTAGVMPDGSVTSVKLGNEAVTTAKILDANVTTEKIADLAVTYTKLTADMQNKIDLINKNLVNILRLKLQMSLSSNDIDAWSDLLTNVSRINTSTSNFCFPTAGSAGIVSIAANGTGQALSFGKTSSPQKVGQFITISGCINGNLSITVKIQTIGSPTDNVRAYIYNTSSGNPVTAIYTSSNTISYSSISSSFTDCTFIFSNVGLADSTQYVLVLARTGSLSDTDYYRASGTNGSLYSGGSVTYYTGSSWTTDSNDLSFNLVSSNVSQIVWTAVTPTEVVTYAAVTADQTVGAGSITWYLSDDGTNWTEVTALDTMQSVNFDAEAVYLKCVLTGDAEVNSVAWGGY